MDAVSARVQAHTKARLQDPSYLEAHKATRRRYFDKRIGYTPELVEALWDQQAGQCAICACNLNKIDPFSMHKQHQKGYQATQRDHCHECKKPRSLLCRGCNLSLGVYERHQRQYLLIDHYEKYLTRHACAH